MRIAIIFSVAVLLLPACQSSGARKMPVTAVAQSNTTSPSLPSPVPKTSPPRHQTFTDADFQKHVTLLRTEIKRKLTGADPHVPAPDFSFVIQPPFVVIGDEPKAAVQQHAEGTVKWAVDRLKQDFFRNDPNEILDIWLFKDAASYEKYTQLLFGETPSTPYGYYSIAHKALIMNIDTGGGTLVHEIVHPFVEANFPACPPGLNEGLGSLFEQCGDTDGHIHGFINWRLPGLQQAIRSKKLPPFKDLMAMDANAFYNEDRGVNYAQARYLCYYLQQKGVLLNFYQQFHDRQKEDPSGYQTLQKILAETDMDAFKTKWEQHVLTLRKGYEVTVE